MIHIGLDYIDCIGSVELRMLNPYNYFYVLRYILLALLGLLLLLLLIALLKNPCSTCIPKRIIRL